MFCTESRCIISIFKQHRGVNVHQYSTSGRWRDVENQRNFLDAAAKDLHIQNMNGWYTVAAKDLQRVGGAGLLVKYNNSPSQLIMSTYPEHNWEPWKFTQSPKGYWDELANQRNFLDSISKDLHIHQMSDWYQITSNDFNKLGSLLKHRYKSSVYHMLQSVYPDHNWIPWKFKQVPKGYWEDIGNHRKFIEWASRELQIKETRDWYKVTQKDFHKLGGSGLIQHKYNSSPSLLLMTMYPDYNWIPWEFEHVPKSYWSDLNFHRKFVERISKQLNIRENSDWHNVNAKQIIDLGGAFLLLKHRSLFNILSQVFPEHNWSSISHISIWDNQDLANYFIQSLGRPSQQLLEHLQKNIVSMGMNDSLLPQLLSQAFPKYNWSQNSTSNVKKSQYILKECLATIFPGEEVLEDYKHPEIVSKSPIELDLFYPKHNLAFEYQGQQHYKYVDVYNRVTALEDLKLRDQQKLEICKKKGITLILIPYWWDRNIESLRSTIYSYRPDLFTSKPLSEPIPLTPPQKPIKSKTSTNKVFMTATEWDESTMDPTGWWMSEKYDGMRLFWNGSQFLTRQGEIVKAPEFITNKLPPVSLDVRTQYGLYQDAVNVIKSEEKWRKAIFWVFDSPEMSEKPFEERIKFLQELKGYGPFVQIVDFVKCTGKEHLKEYLNGIMAKGGEGVMLRESQSLYRSGRSNSLRKLKPFFDTEVKVVKNQYPHGFLCEQINGRTLFVRLNDTYEEAKKVKEGAVISVKHSGTNVYQTLQFPQFYRERTDVKWEDLIKM